MFNTEAFKKSVLNEAIQGKLTQQLPGDGDAVDLLQSIAEEQQQLIQAGKIKKSKQLAAITDDEIPFRIPDNWKWVRLNNILNLNIGKTPARKNEEYWNGNIPWITVKDMNNGLLNNSNEKITSRAAKDKFKNNIAPKGTMLMSFKLSIGKTCILDCPAYYNEAIVSLNFYKYENVLKPYLFRSIGYLTQFAHSKSAVKGNTLNKSSLNNMLIPLPPLAEQQRIVKNIDKCFKLANLIDQEQQLTKDFYNDMYKSLLQSAIQGKLTQQLPEDGNAADLLQFIAEEKQRLYKVGRIKKPKQSASITDDEIPFKIPDNWQWVRLGNVSIINTGNTPPKQDSKYYNSDDIEFVTPANINGTYVGKVNRYLSNNALNKARIATPNSIFVIGIGGGLGRVSIATKQSAFNQQLHNINSLIINFKYLYYCLISNLAQNQFNNKAGTAIPILNKTRISNTMLPLPPLSEQKRIVNKLNVFFKI